MEIDQVVLLASDENRLEDKVFPILHTAGVSTDTLPNQIALKKVWLLCRSRMADSKRVHSNGSAKEDECLPSATRDELSQTWKREHKFMLSGERLLTENIIWQIYT